MIARMFRLTLPRFSLHIEKFTSISCLPCQTIALFEWFTHHVIHVYRLHETHGQARVPQNKNIKPPTNTLFSCRYYLKVANPSAWLTGVGKNQLGGALFR